MSKTENRRFGRPRLAFSGLLHLDALGACAVAALQVPTRPVVADEAPRWTEQLSHEPLDVERPSEVAHQRLVEQIMGELLDDGNHESGVGFGLGLITVMDSAAA